MLDLTKDLDRLLALYPTQAIYIGVHRLRKVMGQYIVAGRGKVPNDDFLMTWVPKAIFEKIEVAVRYIVLEELRRYEEQLDERGKALDGTNFSLRHNLNWRTHLA